MATQLHEMTRVRTPDHWEARLNTLLDRPEVEGDTMLLFVDGLNENRSIDWNALLRLSQASPFSGRVRVLFSTRPHHFEDSLGSGNAVLSGIKCPSRSVHSISQTVVNWIAFSN